MFGPWLVLCTGLLAACGPSGTRQAEVPLPGWVDNPSAPGYVGVVSSAMPQPIGGIEGQRRVALLAARAEMARMQSAQASGTNLTSITASSDRVKISSEDFRRVSSAQALSLYDVSVREQWLHPVTGELFLWLVYPVQ